MWRELTLKESKKQPKVFVTHSIDLSVLINNFIATLPEKNWKLLAVDPVTDKVVLIREVTS
jgi:hypothetical protein